VVVATDAIIIIIIITTTTTTAFIIILFVIANFIIAFITLKANVETRLSPTIAAMIVDGLLPRSRRARASLDDEAVSREVVPRGLGESRHDLDANNRGTARSHARHVAKEDSRAAPDVQDSAPILADMIRKQLKADGVNVRRRDRHLQKFE
jgi:hypothetical protein